MFPFFSICIYRRRKRDKKQKNQTMDTTAWLTGLEKEKALNSVLNDWVHTLTDPYYDMADEVGLVRQNILVVSSDRRRKTKYTRRRVGVKRAVGVAMAVGLLAYGANKLRTSSRPNADEARTSSRPNADEARTSSRPNADEARLLIAYRTQPVYLTDIRKFNKVVRNDGKLGMREFGLGFMHPDHQLTKHLLAQQK
jgi:hypothetical protein